LADTVKPCHFRPRLAAGQDALGDLAALGGIELLPPPANPPVQGARQTIELPDNDGIAVAQMIEHAVQFRPVPAAAGGRFLEQAPATRGSECLRLQGVILLVSLGDAGIAEAPYVLDGLHHHAHQTDLRIVEHYTDTAGATDHVFGLCRLLGYRFVPRIKDLTLQWLSDPALRQRSHAGLNKGEASNALRRAVFFHRQGEIRDRTFENQSFRASGLSLITAAIVHWNTVYLDRAIGQLRTQGATVPDDLLAHVAPLGWEHIGLTGDYVWSV
jgi:Tn3 transposase DDE domain